jgi:hypothetical protein
LIYAAKRPGRRAQKRHAGCVYELRSAQRLADSLIIDIVQTRIWGDNVDHDDLSTCNDADNTTDTESVILQTSGQATFATVTCVFGGTRATSRQYNVELHSCTDLNFLRMPTALLHFLTDHFGVNVRLATEYFRHVYTFRCHPTYQSGSALYDWMNVKFNDSSICPCQLAAVVVLDDNPNNPEPLLWLFRQLSNVLTSIPSYSRNGLGQARTGPFHPTQLIILVLRSPLRMTVRKFW